MSDDLAKTVTGAIKTACANISKMPVHYTTYPGSTDQVFQADLCSVHGKWLPNGEKVRGITQKEKDEYSVIGFNDLSSGEVSELISYCESRIEEYLNVRNDPWSHRRKSSGYIKGTVRYQILSSAKFRFELCGISFQERMEIPLTHVAELEG